MRYQFIHEHRAEYAVPLMCRLLEVSVSGYYAWCKRRPSKHSQEDAQIAHESQVAFEANRQVYGSPPLHAEVQAQGPRCGRKRIARLMGELQLSAGRPGHRTRTTRREEGAEGAENVLQPDFHADQPNHKWVTDTTSIWTAQGWFYLAGVLDLFSRMVIGWSMPALQNATLVEQALQMALARRRPQAG